MPAEYQQILYNIEFSHKALDPETDTFFGKIVKIVAKIQFNNFLLS